MNRNVIGICGCHDCGKPSEIRVAERFSKAKGSEGVFIGFGMAYSICDGFVDGTGGCSARRWFGSSRTEQFKRQVSRSGFLTFDWDHDIPAAYEPPTQKEGNRFGQDIERNRATETSETSETREAGDQEPDAEIEAVDIEGDAAAADAGPGTDDADPAVEAVDDPAGNDRRTDVRNRKRGRRAA